ncbi:MAG TPA: DUF6569 family protein [Planctomycetaceae bacterium]|nr:DUF6569 family protein [Planctomycetaceae bacterium]
MRRLVVLLPMACLVSLAWPLLSPRPDSKALEGLTVGEPWRHANLSIFPVLSDAPRTADRFITLDEGLAAGTVDVFEVGSDGQPVANLVGEQGLTLENGPDAPEAQVAANVEPFDGGSAAQVNRLMVVNRSGKPLYLMPGEVIVGGRQDRTIAEEMILASTGKPTPIDVFCVEHGRWSGRDEGEAAEILAAVAEPRNGASASEYETTLSLVVRQANSGKFVASAGVLSKASRLATQASRDQVEVWDAVAQSNAAAGVSPDSGAFTANYVDPRNRQRLEAYLEQLQGRAAGEPNVVGVVVAINGKVEAVDVFESTPLFRKLWPKLLKSSALDASVAADASRPDRRASTAAAADFLAKALTAEVKEQSHGQGGLVVQQRAAAGVVSVSAGEHVASPSPAGRPADAAAAAGDGGAVHTSALAH